MANTFDVNTRNGSAVMAKMAGMESTANIRSVVSTKTRATASGVRNFRPFNSTTKRCSW